MLASSLDPFSLGFLLAVFVAILALATHAKMEGMTRTRERLLSLLLPSVLSLGLSLVSVYLFNQIDFGSPEALLEIGAHYAARSNSSEPWRFLIAFFVHDELLLALVNGVALLWIGWHLSREIGPLSFAIALITCQIAACFASAEVDPQTLFYGAGAAIVGVSASMLTLQRWRFLKSRDIAALCAVFLHTGVTVLAAFEGAVIEVQTLAVAASVGAGLGLITVFFRRLCERRPPQAVRSAHVFGSLMLFAFFAIASQNLVAPEDVIGALQQARSKRTQLTERLSELESSRSAGTISAGDFANRIESEVQAPVDRVTGEIELLVQSRKTHARWLEVDRKEGAVRSLGLEIIATVYRAKEQLLNAREKIGAGSDSVELETFWQQTLPLLARQVQALHEMSAKSKAQQMLVSARRAAIRDLTDLEASATDLEIMRGEIFLSDLRSLSLGLKSTHEDDERLPASDPDWSQVSSDIVSHKDRLHLIASRIRRPSTRLNALLDHLEKAHAAVALDPEGEAPTK